jgi:hypothetical protein
MQWLDLVRLEHWHVGMVCSREGRVEGALLNVMNDQQSLNCALVMLLNEPATAVPALMVYLRHLLWCFPLHRVYAYVPDLDAADGYRVLLDCCGFRNEGRLAGHLVVGGARRDAMVFGVLRAEFLEACVAQEPQLAL